jgi:hypothetical protein
MVAEGGCANRPVVTARAGSGRPAGRPDYALGMPDVPGLVVCRWCHLLGPDSPEGLIRLPTELEAMALRAGWRFEDEVDDWICPECILRREKAEEN